jgi:hypothetical protein
LEDMGLISSHEKFTQECQAAPTISMEETERTRNSQS